MASEHEIKILFNFITKGQDQIEKEFNRSLKSLTKIEDAIEGISSPKLGKDWNTLFGSTATKRMQELENVMGQAPDLQDEYNDVIGRTSVGLNALESSIQGVHPKDMIEEWGDLPVGQVYKLNKATEKQRIQTDKLSQSNKRFHMELLSVMFAGMALERTMSSLLKPSMDLVGNFDIMEITLATMFLPTALDVQDVLIGIYDYVDAMPESLKKFAGEAVLAGQVLGYGLGLAGQAGLAMFGLDTFIDKFPEYIDKFKELSNVNIFYELQQSFPRLTDLFASLPLIIKDRMTMGNIMKFAAGAFFISIALQGIFDEKTMADPTGRFSTALSAGLGLGLGASAIGLSPLGAIAIFISVMALWGLSELTTWQNAGTAARNAFDTAFLAGGLGGDKGKLKDMLYDLYAGGQGKGGLPQVGLGTVTGIGTPQISGYNNGTYSKYGGGVEFNNTFSIELASGSFVGMSQMEIENIMTPVIKREVQHGNDTLIEQMKSWGLIT